MFRSVCVFVVGSGNVFFILFVNTLFIGYNTISIKSNYRFFRKNFADRAECVPILLFFE